MQWNSGNLLTLGWSDAEELLCVQDDGCVLIYNMFGHYLHAFSMGQEAKDTKVREAKIFASNSGTGVAVMTTNFRIFLINSIKEPKNRQLPEMPSKFQHIIIIENFHSWFDQTLKVFSNQCTSKNCKYYRIDANEMRILQNNILLAV